MQKILFLIISIFLLLEPYLSLASMPVEVKIRGCIEKGYLYSEETDFGTHKVSRKCSARKNKIKSVDKDFKPIDLSPYEGKRIKVSGSLLPGDIFIIEQNNIKVLGWCKNTKKSYREKNFPEKGNLYSNENGKMISEDKAQKIVWGLPEVKQHSERVKSMGLRGKGSHLQNSIDKAGD